MTRVLPIVSDVSIGNAQVAIDCVWLKCISKFDFRVTMESVPIICDWAQGKVTALRGNPSGSISIDAKNLNSTLLGFALDANVSVKSGDDAAACVKVMGIQWVPDDVATPTQWSAIIHLNSPDVDNVDVFTDDACTTPWDSASTPMNTIAETYCTGIVVLTTDDVSECDDTLYFSFDWDIEIPDGAEIICPAFGTFAEDHIVRAWHRNATTGQYEIYEFWRCQIIPDMSLSHDDSNKVVMVPIRLEVLADPDFHPDCPLGRIVISDTLPTSLSSLL